jgi:glycosyltransferase involved in cell wall biosynthesis
LRTNPTPYHFLLQSKIPHSMAKGRPTLSVCMIVRNEEQNLPRVLSSVRGLADEIVVVDTGSADRTVEVAESFGAKTYYFEWCDDFAAARNESLKHATKDYVLWLDADDEFHTADAVRLRKVIGGHYGKAMYLVIRLVKENYVEECSQLRAFPRRKEIIFEGRIHEQPNLSIQRLGIASVLTDVKITHYGYETSENIREKLQRNLRILEKELAERPDNLIARFFHGKTMLGLGKTDEGLRVLEDLVERGEKDGFFRKTEYLRIAYFDLINVFFRMGDNDQVKKTISEYERLFSKDFFSTFFQGNTLMREERYGEAAEELGRAANLGLKVRTFPVNTAQYLGRLHAYLGFCSAKTGKDVDARRFIRLAVSECPDDEEILDCAGETYISLKDSDGLASILAVTTSEGGAYYYRKGMFHLFERRFEDALEMFERAVDLGYARKNCYLALIVCLEATGSQERIVKVVLKALERYDGDKDLLKKLAKAYVESLKLEDARPVLAALNGNNDVETIAMAAYVGAAQGNWEEMLSLSVRLLNLIDPGRKPSAEEIFQLQGMLLARNETEAARYIALSIDLLAKLSPF